MESVPEPPDPQSRLKSIWRAIESRRPQEHTSVVVPSLSFHRDELAKIAGVRFYEERLLFLLLRLRDPRARVIYLTSQPIHPEIVDYYVHLVAGVPARSARQRLTLLSVHDASPRPLSEKILERPRVVERIRRSLGDPRWAYLTCFTSTSLERRLAEALAIPVDGVDPDLRPLGTKSGSRRVFAAAGVEHPAGREGVGSEAEIVDALCELASLRPGLRRAVLKLDDSFAGAGNAIFRYPTALPAAAGARREAIFAALGSLEWGADEDYGAFRRKMEDMGGVVEEHLEADDLRSPSVQLRIDPAGGVEMVSTHDQVLGGSTGQAYVGCRFPAEATYRPQIQSAAAAIGRVLRDRGVIGCLSIDFVTWRQPGGGWRAAAIEINLRMGATTTPFIALESLTGGRLDPETGQFLTPRGRAKSYYATDRLHSPAYRGLVPEDFFDIVAGHGLGWTAASETGILFHMIGALSEFGKVGVTCIGDSRNEADGLFRCTREALDEATGGGCRSDGLAGNGAEVDAS